MKLGRYPKEPWYTRIYYDMLYGYSMLLMHYVIIVYYIKPREPSGGRGIRTSARAEPFAASVHSAG